MIAERLGPLRRAEGSEERVKVRSTEDGSSYPALARARSSMN